MNFFILYESLRFYEKALQALFGYIGYNALRVLPQPGTVNGGGIEIGSKYLDTVVCI